MAPEVTAPDAHGEDTAWAAAQAEISAEQNASVAEKVESSAAEKGTSQAAASGNAQFLLFKTPTCPNCKAAGALLDKAGISYTALNANEEKELVGTYGVKQAPTLVILNEGGFEKYRGVSDIKGWLMHRKVS